MSNIYRLRRKHKLLECMGGKCQNCGYNKYHGALDFHHIDGTEKDATISHMLNKHIGIRKIILELKKCILLCCRCHREHHGGLLDLPVSYAVFDDEKFTQLIKAEKPKITTTPCKICGKQKPKRNETCSTTCKALAQYRVDWASIDLHNLYVAQKLPILRIGKMLNVSGNAVKKHIKKQNLVR